MKIGEITNLYELKTRFKLVKIGKNGDF